MKEPWPPARIEQLKTLIASGLDYSEIGRRMQLSKNAVLGKAHRLGYGTPKPVREPVAECVFPDTGHCLFPIGNPTDRDFRFCGAAVSKEGASYCERHHAVCLVPVNANALKQINFAAGKLGKPASSD